MKNTHHSIPKTSLPLLFAVVLAVSGCTMLDSLNKGSDQGSYRVQVATYAEQGLGVAESIRKQLEAGGLSAYLVPVGDEHVLYVGSELSKRAANSAKRKTDRIAETNSLVVPH